MEFRIDSEEYMTPFHIGKRIEKEIIGKLVNTSRKKHEHSGNIEIPEEGGEMTVKFEEVFYEGIGHKRELDRKLIYSITCEFPKESVTWYNRLMPGANVLGAPINNFKVDISEKFYIENEKGKQYMLENEKEFNYRNKEIELGHLKTKQDLRNNLEKKVSKFISRL